MFLGVQPAASNAHGQAPPGVSALWWGAERDISKGEQLLHTYGDLSDAQLLQTYGFVEDFQPGYDNPHNFVPVPVQVVLQSCSESGDEVILLSWP